MILICSYKYTKKRVKYLLIYTLFINKLVWKLFLLFLCFFNSPIGYKLYVRPPINMNLCVG